VEDNVSTQRERNPWRTGVIAVLALLLLGGVAVAGVLVLGGDKASGQTIEFQQADETGANPFTPATDVAGDTSVETAPPAAGGTSAEPSSGAGTFGGSGSNTVCDREKLIRELLARPDRMRAWAGVLGVDPTPKAVKRYIRSLRPVTLTRDTQVTNHAYRNGQIVSFQSILEAGTAVLVDKYGKPVARCRCGNPLTEPVFYKKATCHNCPPNYTPPPPCKWRPYDPYDENYGVDPTSGKYLTPPPTTVVFKKNSYSTCYVFYPQPPMTEFDRKFVPLAKAASPPTYTQTTPQYYAPHYTPPTHTYTDPCGYSGCPPPDEGCGAGCGTDPNAPSPGINCNDPNTHCNSYP
jgi:hypothetical protein